MILIKRRRWMAYLRKSWNKGGGSEEFGRHALFRESLLKQQSRSKRLQGDSNSKYFHIIINWRRRQNMIRGINVNAGYGRRNLKKWKNMHGIFSKIGLVRRIGGRPCLDGVMFERITHEDNTMLIGKFGEMEIQEAIWECGSAKSLGPNGYNFRFIKKFWETLKGDVINFVNNFMSLKILWEVLMLLSSLLFQRMMIHKDEGIIDLYP